jgi:hypothetical protein
MRVGVEGTRAAGAGNRAGADRDRVGVGHGAARDPREAGVRHGSPDASPRRWSFPLLFEIQRLYIGFIDIRHENGDREVFGQAS